MRIDRAVARGIANYLSSISKNQKFTVQDFSPFDREASKVDIDDPESMLAALTGLSN